MTTRLIVVTALLLVGAAPAAAQSCADDDYSCQRSVKDKTAADDAYYERQRQVEREQVRRALLKQPPLPAERNGLLGSWRLDGGPQGQTAAILGQITGGGPGDDSGWDGLFRDLANMVTILEKGACEAGFGSGATFSPATYSIHGEIPVAYRAGVLGGKPAIAAIPGDSAQDMMIFAIASPDRIVGEDGCVLVRVGALSANAAANATTARGKLAVGPDAGGYLCPDGRQLYVESCYDELPDARCGIVNVHLPKRGRYQVVSSEVRSTLMSSVAACKVYPVDFGDDGTVSLVLPESVAPAPNSPKPGQ